jgi:plasmid maintenance system killer protein
MQSRAASKLDQINAAEKIDDLRIPPSNRLEKPEHFPAKLNQSDGAHGFPG